MGNLIISQLDHQRLTERVGKAKADTRISHSQIINLLRGIDSATLLDPTKIPANVVTMNSRVKLLYPESRKTLDIQLVYPEEADSTQNRISVFAPLATAVLGRREKELVGLVTPYGTVKVKIERILYQPEAAGDFLL